MDNPPTTTGDSPPPSPPSQPQESIINRKILPRGLPHSFSSNLNRDVATPSKKGGKTNKRTVQSIIASIESAAASKQQLPLFPLAKPITPRNSTIRSSASTGASLTSFRRVKGTQGRERGVSECHDARSRHDEDGAASYSDAGSALEGTRSVSTPVIPRASSIMPFALEEEDSLTLLNYKSYFNQPLARCLDGFADFREDTEDTELETSKNEEKKLSSKPDIDKENKPLRITKRRDRVKTAAQTETHPTTSAPRPVQRQSRRPSLVHRKSSASVIALEKLMHELENFSINPPLEEEDSEIIAMPEDKPIIRRDPKEVQGYWWKVRCGLWIDDDEIYNPEDYPESNIAISSNIPKIQLPLPGTANVSARVSCAFDKQIPLPAPPIPFRSPNRVSSLGRGSPSPKGTPARVPNRSVSIKSTSPLKYSVLAAGHPPPSPSASVRPEFPTPLLFRQSPSPPPRSSKRPVSPPLSTAGKDEYLNDDTPRATQANLANLTASLHEQTQSRGPSGSSLDVNASTPQADWKSSLEYGDEDAREHKAQDKHRRRTQPNGPSLDEIDGLFRKIPTFTAASSPTNPIGDGDSQENTPKAGTTFDQIKKRIDSIEEERRSAHSRRSSLVRLATSSSGDSSEHHQPHHLPKDQKEVHNQSQPQLQLEEEQESPNRHDNRRHSRRRRLHLSAIHLPGLRHLRNRHSKLSLPSSDSDSQQTPTTANSFSSTRATISSPIPILSAGISNPDSTPGIVPSIPYSVTRSARSSLVSISESAGAGSSSRSLREEGQRTPTEGKMEGTGATVVSYPRQFVAKVPKLEEAPKGRGSEDGSSGGGGFRAHFRKRSKSRCQGKTSTKDGDKMMEERLMLKDNVEEFLHSHKRNSPRKEELGRSVQSEGTNDLAQPHKGINHQLPEPKEGTTGTDITSSISASSIPLSTIHRFDRSRNLAGGDQLTSLDDSNLPNNNPSTQTPYPNYANTISHFTRYPMLNTSNTSNPRNTSPAKPSPPKRPQPPTRPSREAHLSEIESFLNHDTSNTSSFHNLQSMRSLHSQLSRQNSGSGSHSHSMHSHSHSQSMHSIPESRSSGSMYSQDRDDNKGRREEGKRREEEEKREDASMLIGEVLETVRGLGEDVVKGRRG